MSPILDIQRRLRELGRIRMGVQVERDGKRRPEKLRTWRLTSASKQLIDEAAQNYGGTVQEWADAPGEAKQWEVILESDALDIVIPPGQSLSQWYETWTGGGCQKRCDGERQVLADRACSCPEDPVERAELAKDGKACKPVTRLNVMLPRLPDLGVWRLETHGYYAASELAGMAELCRRATEQGTLVPARLRLEQRTTKRPGQPAHHFVVPVIEVPEQIGKLLEAIGAIGPGGGLALAPIERKALPGSAGETTPEEFGVERAGSVEHASMPGDRPPLPEDQNPEWTEQLVAEGISEHLILLIARRMIREGGGTVNISKLADLRDAPQEWRDALTAHVREAAQKVAQSVPARSSEGSGPSEETTPVDAPEGLRNAPVRSEVTNPCPICGEECYPIDSSNPRSPKWGCSNATCPGDEGSDEGPWVSWHRDPWKSGGQIETEYQAVGAGAADPALRDDGAKAGKSPAPPDVQEGSPPAPAHTSEGGGEPPPPEPAPSLLDSQEPDYLDLIENALDAGLVRFADIKQACTYVLSRHEGVKAPGNRSHLKNKPPEFLRDLAEKLKLPERMGES